MAFAFSFFGRFLLLFFRCVSRRHLLLAGSRFSLDSDGPDEAQQFSSDRRHDLPLILACHGQLHVALVQAILRLPCYFDDLCRNILLWFPRPGPDARQVLNSRGW